VRDAACASRARSEFKVDEEDAAFAAATRILLVPTAAKAGPPPFQKIIDHPFFFTVSDRQWDATLFAGLMTNPTQS
jgi:serine protease inhibitor